MHLPPAQFWAMSLAEWRLIAGEEAGALTRAGLDSLRQQFPDEGS